MKETGQDNSNKTGQERVESVHNKQTKNTSKGNQLSPIEEKSSYRNPQDDGANKRSLRMNLVNTRSVRNIQKHHNLAGAREANTKIEIP